MALATPKQRGYTLIEILIIMLVTALIMGMGLAAYVKFNNSQKTKQAVYGLVTELRQVQKLAESGNHSCGAGVDYGGYRFFTLANAGSADISQICGGSYILQKTYYLPDKTSFAAGYNITFSRLTGAITGGGTIGISGPGGVKNVVLTPGGSISTD